MRNGRYILIAVLMGLALLCLWALRPDARLVYQGKPLAFWLAGYDQGAYSYTHPHGPLPPRREQADAAIREMGTNAIPTLVRMLQMPNTRLQSAISKLLRDKSFLNIRYATPNKPWKALFALQALGPIASNAVPDLVALLERDPTPFPQQAVPTILAGIGPAAEPAVPALLRAAAHTNENVRNNAIFALGQIHARPKEVVPLLIKCLKDPDPQVQAQSSIALRMFGSEALAAFPALLQLWRETPYKSSGDFHNTAVSEGWIRAPLTSITPAVAASAAEALRAIDPPAAAKAGVK